MRIDELTPYRDTRLYKSVKRLRHKHIVDIKNALIRLKYFSKKQNLGNGMFATVFERDGDPYVIKMFQSDQGYLTYLKYVQSHQDNPHVPKIKGKVMQPFKDAELYLIRIEKLESLYDSDHMHFNTFAAFHDYIRGKAGEVGINFLQERYPFLVKLADDIRQLGRSIDLHNYNVMVRPSDNTLVVTDPLT